MPGSDGLRILGFEKRVSWDSTLEEGSWFSELAKARTIVCSGVPHMVGVRWKSQDRKKLCLSLLMSKNLKLKRVIKSFVPEPKKRVVSVSCFSDSFVYEHLWTFSVSVWICLFHVFVSWSYIFGHGYATSLSLSLYIYIHIYLYIYDDCHILIDNRCLYDQNYNSCILVNY